MLCHLTVPVVVRTSSFTHDATGPVITTNNFTDGVIVAPGLALRWNIADAGTITMAEVQAPGAHTYTVICCGAQC